MNRPVWESDTPIDLPELAGSVTADVCVVGLGGSGLACIADLLAHGKRVVGIDAADVAAGAAGRNGGFLLGGLAMFHHDAVVRLGRSAAAAIYRRTLAELDGMFAETPDAIRRTGTLRIATSAAEREDCERQLAAMRADALPVVEYDGPEGQGLLFPFDAAFDPAARCQSLARAVLANGAQLFVRSPATSVDRGRVITPAGEVLASDIVVAVDGRLEQIFPELLARVRTARLQMLATEPLSAHLFRHPVYARWGLDYWQQRPDGRIVLGGCRDAGGEAEWTTSSEPTAEVQNALNALLRDKLEIGARVTHRWAASVAYSVTGLPILEEVRPRIFAVGAYSGTGNVLGAVAGRAAAELVVNGWSASADLLRA